MENKYAWKREKKVKSLGKECEKEIGKESKEVRKSM